MKKLTVLSVCIVLIFGLSFTSSAIASDEDEILQLTQNFAVAMQTADCEFMSSLWWQSDKTTAYFPDRPFLLEGEGAVSDVWKSLCLLPAGTHAPTFHNTKVTMYGDDMALSTYYANHVYTDPTTKEQIAIPLRATFVVKKISGKWLIVHQHTSVLPTDWLQN